MKETLAKSEERAPERLRREPGFITPFANIHERSDAYVVEVEMPGVRKEGLEVTVANNELTIVGHRVHEKLPGEVFYRESREADFRRAFDLDPSIDAGKINAKIEDGILRLTLPKSERVQPKKIAIQ